MTWWQSFFDHDYLRLWGPNFEDCDADLEAAGAVGLAGLSPPGRILDVPCGFGRVSRPLAEMGFNVVGIDSSPEMIAEGREHCAGVAVELIEGDMRELVVDAPFDAAFCLFSSIGYTGNPEDDLGFFRAVRSKLAPGGSFVIETAHRDRRAAKNIGRYWFEVDGRPVVAEGFMDWVTGVGGEILRWEDDGTWHEKRFEVYHYTATELRRMLLDAGFEEIEVYGSFDRRPFTPDTRLVIVAR